MTATVEDTVTAHLPSIPADDASPSRTVVAGHYEVDLDHPLGSGGMAVVYRGRDLRTRRVVALKTLREEYRRDPETRARFRREARSMAFAQHPNVARLFDLYEDDEGPWAILEYVPGRSLKAEIAANGPFDLETASHLLDQIASALTHLHKKRLVHLDVKPHNVLITPDQTVKLIDFGLAQRVGQSQEMIGGQAFGSAAYLAPEQACGDPVSAATDVYSLGCVVYEMLTGTAPFGNKGADEDKEAIIRAHIEDAPQQLTLRRPDLRFPTWVDDVVLWAMVKQPEDRYDEAVTFAHLFSEHVRNGTPPEDGSEERPNVGPVRTVQFAPSLVVTGNQPYVASQPRPVFGNQLVASAYRAGGRHLRGVRVKQISRRLWQAIAIVALANLLLAGVWLINDGSLPGVIAADATLAAGHEARVVSESFRLRAAPGLAADTLTMVGAGDVLEITGPAQDVDGRTWWPVTFRGDGNQIEGFIAQEGIAPVKNHDRAIVSDMIDKVRDLIP